MRRLAVVLAFVGVSGCSSSAEAIATPPALLIVGFFFLRFVASLIWCVVLRRHAWGGRHRCWICGEFWPGWDR